ncbi:MAG: MarR family transcriptional regulator [Pseudodesulfovibrio sp.]|nr:MarR family transcriptional regulator [Pseudodesulfovibrio sp.]
MLYQNDTYFFTLLSRFQRNYSKALAMRLSPYDVNPGYLSVLHTLWQQDNIIQKELNKHVCIEQATLSNTLARMERDGLIERKAGTEDRRLLQICLTVKGHDLQAAVTAAIEDLKKTVNTGLTINDRKYFKRIMKQMTEHLENDLHDPCLMLFDEISE